MVCFSTVQSTLHPHWAFLIECYQASFPPDERRPVAMLEELLKQPDFLCQVLLYDEMAVGLFLSWRFSTFRYIEHFAISPSFRGKMIGKTALNLFLQQSSLPVILEVEPPTDETAIRRIRFYEKEAFVLNDKVFIQPPYSPDQHAVELRLMEWGGKLLVTTFASIKDVLYGRVYGIRTLCVNGKN